MIRGLFGRLLIVICGAAAASTALVLVLQERSLSRDLELAAQLRLESAAQSASRLAAIRLDAMAERYRAVAGTPQFRATLEVNHGPTLVHYAESLMGRHGAVRISFVDPAERVAGGAGDPLIDTVALAVDEAGLVAFEGEALAVVEVAVPGTGRLVAAEPLGTDVLDDWSELCGARVSFAPVGSTPETQLSRVVREVGTLEMRVSTSLDAERAAMANARRSLFTAGALGILLAFFVSLGVTRGLVQPIRRLQAAAQRIGDGDLTVRIDTARRDEIGEAARSFDEMIRSLRGTIRSVVDAADQVEGTAGEIDLGARELLSVVGAQREHTDETAATLGSIQERVRAIASAAGESTDRLDASVDGSTASFRELAGSGERLEQNANSLSLCSADITSSIQQISAAAAAVATDTEGLLPAVDAAMARVTEMADVARTINRHAQETTQLSAKVVDSAEQGRQVVRDAVDGMQTTRDTISDSEHIIEGLRQQVQQIGSILGVIDDVTDETSLLALNGSIIAAQAGQHGRAFSVVADQLASLAKRVRSSTQEIEQVIEAVQTETAKVVESIARGSERANLGAELIQKAEVALAAITDAARESRERMAESLSGTARQTETATAVAEDMNGVRAGVGRIRDVTREQADATGIAERSAEGLLAVAKEVQEMAALQTRGAARIGAGIEAVQRTVREMKSGLDEQAAASDQVAGVVRGATRYTEAQHASASQIDRATRELGRQAEALRAAMRRFRIEESG